jgi:hypothetical protein
LLQISPNWFLGKRTLDPRLKWALVVGLSRDPGEKEEEESRYLVQVPTGHDSQPLVLDCISVAAAAAAAAVAEITH